MLYDPWKQPRGALSKLVLAINNAYGKIEAKVRKLSCGIMYEKHGGGFVHTKRDGVRSAKLQGQHDVFCLLERRYSSNHRTYAFV